MKKEKEVEEANYTLMQKLLYLFIIPLLFLVVIVLGYLTYQGKNVFDLAQSFLPEKQQAVTKVDEEEEKNVTSSVSEQTKQQETAQQVILLEREISNKQREIAKLASQLVTANDRIKILEQQQQEVKVSTKELANLYERMSTKKAAQILTELEEGMALLILNELSTSKASSILGQLEPEQAARFTELLAKQE
jgi:flagellar motility protein MotE (MotC chaperone)